MSAIFRETIGRLRATIEQDSHGNDKRVYPAVDAAVPIFGWAVDATGTSEDTDARVGTLSRVTARRRGSTDVVASDRLLWRGTVYEIEGDVQFQPGPSSMTSHIIVALKIAEG